LSLRKTILRLSMVLDLSLWSTMLQS
jgi:hypothetical protein